MLYALADDDRKIEAYPNGSGRCPGCKALLIPKCGSVIRWHWAHKPTEDCDPWWEPECNWHYNWKSLVEPGFCEVTMGEHRADICAPNGRVVELQHSSISFDDIQQRESFYGNRLLWVFDASEFRRNLHFRNRGSYYSFRWKWPRLSLSGAELPVFWDLGFNRMFHVRKVHWELPCGGWGTTITKTDFLKQYLREALKDEVVKQLKEGAYDVEWYAWNELGS